jgi:hypothetical protein
VTSTLPTWEQMSETDQSRALQHIWKAYWDDPSYAREHYPAEYVDHPELTALSPKEACAHAKKVTGGHEAIQDRLGMEEWERLYYVALD